MTGLLGNVAKLCQSKDSITTKHLHSDVLISRYTTPINNVLKTLFD